MPIKRCNHIIITSITPYLSSSFYTRPMTLIIIVKNNDTQVKYENNSFLFIFQNFQFLFKYFFLVPHLLVPFGNSHLFFLVLAVSQHNLSERQIRKSWRLALFISFFVSVQTQSSTMYFCELIPNIDHFTAK